jgi:TonB family protein
VVAGQAGITRAYRIGANLVLTKPINVEQTKGTLRVARGLLRKTSEAAGITAPTAATGAAPASPASPTLVSTPLPGEHDRRNAPRLVFSSVPHETSESQPSLSQETRPAESPAAVPNRIAAEKLPARQPAFPGAINNATNATDDNTVESGAGRKQTKSEADTAPAGSSPARNTISAFPSPTGSATAPASAPEVALPKRGANKVVESQPADPSRKRGILSHDSTPGTTFSSEPANDSPLFAGGRENSGSLSDNKKMLIAAIIVLALAALGYLGYELLIKSMISNAAQRANLSQDSEGSAGGVNPQPVPAAASSTSSTSPAKAAPTAPSGQQPASLGQPAVISIVANTSTHVANDSAPADALEISKPNSKPLQVKSNVTRTKSQLADDSAPQLAATVASADENKLTGVISSAPTSVPKLSLTTVKVSQGVSEGLLIKRVQPKYPRAAMSAHTEGSVQIEATVNKEGFVKHPRVLKGDPILARAALDAVSQWRYKPYYLDGAPVEIQTQITVNFRPN